MKKHGVIFKQNAQFSFDTNNLIGASFQLNALRDSCRTLIIHPVFMETCGLEIILSEMMGRPGL